MLNSILFLLPKPAASADSLNAADSAKLALATVAEELVKDPNKALGEFGRYAIEFGLKVVAAILIYLIGAWIIRRITKFLNRLFIKKGTEKILMTFITSVVSISLTILLIVITISTLGINTTSLAAVLAAGGVAIGMALSGTVQNFAGGIMILVFKPFKAGEYIKAQGHEGMVVDVSIVNTKIRQYDNTVIILPNGALFNGNIENVTTHPYHRVSWKVNVAFGTDAERIKGMLISIADSEPRILHKGDAPDIPDPFAHIDELRESSVQFALKAWVKTEDYWDVLFDINERIYTELPQNGIQFPFPRLDVNISQQDR